MKVLQIHNQYHFKGGEDIVVENEKKLLKSNGHIVDQLFRSNKIEIKSKFDQLKVLKNLKYSIKSKNILKKKIDQFKPDIVHVHNTFPLWTYSIFDVLNKQKIPTVVTLHNYRLIWDKIVFKNDFYKYAGFKNSKIKTYIISKYINSKKKCLENIKFYIVLSKFSKKQFSENGLKKKYLYIKQNFLKQKRINNKKIEKKNIAIYASRIEEEKGILTLLNSWKNIKLDLKIFGDGPLYNELKQNNKNKKIFFQGHQKFNIIDKNINNSKFLIFPSKLYENMPITILQAFREKTLVLASDIGSMKEMIKDGYNGILFKHNCHKSLRSKINWILSNPKLCNKITNSAYKFFIKNYSDKLNYKILLNIYKTAIRKNNFEIK